MAIASSDQGIVRFIRLDSSDDVSNEEHAHVRMRMLFDDCTILTCAHVVNVALRRNIYEPIAPDEGTELTVTFPIINDENKVTARLVGWSSPGRKGLDCVVLRLDKPAPEGVNRTILSLVPPQDMINADLSIYGSLAPGHPGTHLNARLLGEVGAQWNQLDVRGRFGVQPGFSGGAVWDRKQRTSIGMVVARQIGTEGATAYFLPSEKIAECFSELVPVEVRKTPLRSQLTFSIFAILLFALMLIHFLAMQGSSSVVLVPWAQEDKELAALFGAHCFVLFLGPFVMWHAVKHARSFALRRWWQRVPVAFGGNSATMLDHSKLSAAMVVLFLLLLPAYGQGAFLDKVFFQERPVFVNITRIEQTRPCIGARERQNFLGCRDIGVCQRADTKWCKHENVGVWSFLKSFPYFNHVYQIAGTCETPTNCKMVTFFPLLQPLILFLATFFVYAYFFLFVWALMRPWPHPLSSKKGE